MSRRTLERLTTTPLSSATQRPGGFLLPERVTAELLAFHIDGAGTQQTDLAQVLPASSSLKASGDILFRLLQGATDERQDQKIAIEVTAAAG